MVFLHSLTQCGDCCNIVKVSRESTEWHCPLNLLGGCPEIFRKNLRKAPTFTLELGEKDRKRGPKEAFLMALKQLSSLLLALSRVEVDYSQLRELGGAM